ncbi:MAG TPA: hypothetical protein VFF06_26210 [Polyangia bacterium]|nr:hypothetical protein [Polyangia bacterium]
MKKLAALLVVAAIGFGVYRYVLRPPEKRACARMADLCNMKPDELDRCTRDIAELRKNMTPEAQSKMDSCVSDAKTCAESAGCVVGGGVSAAADMFNQFLKGFGGATK